MCQRSENCQALPNWKKFPYAAGIAIEHIEKRQSYLVLLQDPDPISQLKHLYLRDGIGGEIYLGASRDW